MVFEIQTSGENVCPLWILNYRATDHMMRKMQIQKHFTFIFLGMILEVTSIGP